MLLSLLGTTISRSQALALFNLNRTNPDYEGASHNDIGAAFSSRAKVKRWHWEYYKKFDFALLKRSLCTQLRAGIKPTLLSFGAVHRNGVWRCTHVTVVICISDKGIEMLDPLGTRPSNGTKINVLLTQDKTGSIHIIGSSYTVDYKSEAAVFRWSRR
jgi:hypothetical protein